MISAHWIGQIKILIMHKGSKYTIERQTAYDAVEGAAEASGVPFRATTANQQSWYGVASPLMNFLTGFDLRFSELRLGHHVMNIRKDRAETLAIKVAQYGLNGAHHVLLEGVTFPPEKRSAMAQSLGPMTVLLNYIKSEGIYVRKWEVAAKRAFAHFPQIDSILEAIKGPKPEAVHSTIQAMGDLALLTSTRQATRMFPPPNAFYKILSSNKTVKENFTFSGPGAFLFYKEFQKTQWIMDGNMSEGQAAQIVYHCTFGTYKEDLSILSQVTDFQNWSTREEFGGCMRQANTCGKSVKFNPIKQKFYSKLSSANQTGFLTSNYTQLSVIPVFSGRRKQTFKLDFFEYLASKQSVFVGSKSLHDIASNLRPAKTIFALVSQSRFQFLQALEVFNRNYQRN